MPVSGAVFRNGREHWSPLTVMPSPPAAQREPGP